MSNAPTRMNPSTLPDAGALGYSQISVTGTGRLAFVSGQVAATPAGDPTPSDLGSQTEQVVANLKAALQALNAQPGDIVQMRIYVIDLNDEAMSIAMPPLLAFLDGAQPSVTGIGVAALAGADLKIEVEMVVQVPD
ncbi:MAG: RidA family protein [Ruegeria sp.]